MSSSSSSPALVSSSPSPQYKLFVGGISWRADESSLAKYFGTFGNVLECKIIMDRATQKSKGYGFITFDDEESIVKVRSASSLLFMGKNLMPTVDSVTVKSSFYLTEWDVIGPFPSAPREDVDALEAFGGITGIPRGDSTTYPTDITDDGRAGWTHMSVSDGNVNINYNESQGVNWPLIEAWAGSSGSYFSGWGLSDFTLDNDEIVVITCQGVAKMYLDNHVLQGDTYGSGIAFQSMSLFAGTHTVRTRIIGSEGAGFICSVSTVDPSTSASLMLVLEDTIVPDIVNNAFASPYVSITVLNLLNNTVTIVEAAVQSPFEIQIFKRLSPIEVGQQTPLNLVLQTESSSAINCPAGTTYAIPITISTDNGEYIPLTLNFSCKSFGDAYTFTFLDFDQSVQYAAATPPLYPCNSQPCPVLLTLHGADVDAKSTAWTGAYQRQNYSWTLFPTNRRNYGWDWQGPGLKNAFSALNALVQLLPGVPVAQSYKYHADPSRLIYAGHSMGGHGAFTISTHYPDAALCVAVAAGWISMPVYSPFFLRLADSWTDPFVRFLEDAAVAEHNTDMYTPHLVGIPLITRFGSIDDNVPPYHLRRMTRLYDELSRNATAGLLSMVPGEGHWFNGVVDDAIMQSFFNQHVQSAIPTLPSTFIVTTLNPASSGSRGGIQILQLTQPYRVAKIRVTGSTTSTWTLRTQNVRRIGFVPFAQAPTSIVIDGQTFKYAQYPTTHFCGGIGNWEVCTSKSWLWAERNPATYGPVVQIVQSPLLFVYGTQGSAQQTQVYRDAAVYLSNTLYYQMRYAIDVMSDNDFSSSLLSTYNVVLFGGPANNTVAHQFQSNFPVTFDANTYTIGNNKFGGAPGVGVIFLAPCSTNYNQYRQGCMMTVIEGTDSAGFTRAFGLFPTKSDIPTPDFAVAAPTVDYSGVAGLQALGFWNNQWQFDATNSYVSYIQN
eukprot:gene13893-16389_t